MDTKKVCQGCFCVMGSSEKPYVRNGLVFHSQSCELRKQNRDYHTYLRSLDSRPLLFTQESRMVH
jgi:hypothetical protein